MPIVTPFNNYPYQISDPINNPMGDVYTVPPYQGQRLSLLVPDGSYFQITPPGFSSYIQLSRSGGFMPFPFPPGTTFRNPNSDQQFSLVWSNEYISWGA